MKNCFQRKKEKNKGLRNIHLHNWTYKLWTRGDFVLPLISWRVPKAIYVECWAILNCVRSGLVCCIPNSFDYNSFHHINLISPYLKRKLHDFNENAMFMYSRLHFLPGVMLEFWQKSPIALLIEFISVLPLQYFKPQRYHDRYTHFKRTGTWRNKKKHFQQRRKFVPKQFKH